MKLSDKQKAFCHEYTIDLNATQAAIRAGYSPRTAQEQSSRLLSKAIVSDHVARLQEKQAEKAGIKAGYVLQSIHDIAKNATELVETESGLAMRNPMAALRAYEMLGKHLALFTDKVVRQSEVQLTGFVFVGR